VCTKNRGPGHHFSAFYEDNALLIQFVVNEFIQSYQLTLKIKLLVQEHLDSHPPSDALIFGLIQILGQLVGCPPQQERPSSISHWTKGPLTKFKEHCEQFSRNSLHQNKQHVDLHMAAHQAWLISLHTLELLNSLTLNPYVANPKTILFLSPLKRAFQHLQIRINQIIRYIPRIMNVYWNNENVLLCLLRKKELLTEIYGPDFLHKRFKWPLKTAELIQLLIERYQARGFDSLLPTIQQLLVSKEILYDAR
jgi:hypothetical protein